MPGEDGQKLAYFFTEFGDAEAFLDAVSHPRPAGTQRARAAPRRAHSAPRRYAGALSNWSEVAGSGDCSESRRHRARVLQPRRLGSQGVIRAHPDDV